jgi:hypothetical protein
VFNLEVAHSHTFAVGPHAVLVHNGKRPDAWTGEFDIIDWADYPQVPGVPRPTGPVQVLTGEEYEQARAAADKENRRIQRTDPEVKGKHLHEVKPVKMNGSPTARANKVALDPKTHTRFTTWWRRLARDVTKCPRKK